MSCATCSKNEICIIKKDLSEFRDKCEIEIPKACQNCYKGDKCVQATLDGYCKFYRSMHSKSILFPGESSGGGILL